MRDVVAVGTSVLALIVASMAYRRANVAKARDLRIQLGKAVVEVRHIIDGLPGLIQRAKLSREHTFAAAGRPGSGAMQAWEEQCNADMKKVDALEDTLPSSDNDRARITDHAELEDRLVSAHDLTVKANDMQVKYERELADDQKTRDRLAAADPRYQLIGRPPPGL